MHEGLKYLPSNNWNREVADLVLGVVLPVSRTELLVVASCS